MDYTLHSYIYNYIPIKFSYSLIEQAFPLLSFFYYIRLLRKPHTFRVISKYMIYVKNSKGTPYKISRKFLQLMNLMKVGTMGFSVMLNTNLALFS